MRRLLFITATAVCLWTAGASATFAQPVLDTGTSLFYVPTSVFDAFQTLSLSLAAMTGMVEDMTPDPKRMKAAAGAGYATATDLADWLVRALKIPFREAHAITGRIVALAAKRGARLEKLTLDEIRSVEPRITSDVFGVLRVERSVKSRTSYGGTAPGNVRHQARGWLRRLGTG